MALIGSLTSGVSAMQSFVKGMEVIGNNIANSKTTAFKRQRVGYSDSFSNTLRDASPGNNNVSSRPGMQVGSGVNLNSTTKVFDQGSIEGTGVTSDLAIVGEGFFRVLDPSNSNQFLTRNGSLRVDSEGYLAEQTGKRLIGLTGGTAIKEPDTLGVMRIDLEQAVKTNADGNPVDELGRVVLDDGMRLQAGDDGTLYHVNANGELLDPPSESFALQDIGGTEAVEGTAAVAGTPAFAVLDADGQRYLQNAAGEYIDGNGILSEDAGGVAVPVVWNPDAQLLNGLTDPGNGLVLRDIGGTAARAVLDGDDGKYYLQNTAGQFIGADGIALAAGEDPVEWNPASLAKAVLGDDEATVSVWSVDNAFQPSIATPDETDPNQFRLAIQSWAVGPTGDLTVSLNDGTSHVRGKVLIQALNDPDSLTSDGTGLFSGFENAGQVGLQSWTLGTQLTSAEVGAHTAGSQGLGFIQGGALEGSNTDLTFEFSEMITTQRAFQAGSRVISVSDEMLQEIINLKR